MTPDDLKSRAGLLLYRELPEEYRYRDPAAGDELGDLEAYLHAFGHLLDLIRGTTEQAYADAFAEPADNGRAVQVWMIPYLADLVAAELKAPVAEARRAELNYSVAWYKAKGSVEAVDEIAGVVGDAEAVLIEGWRHVLATPRVTLPPFTAEAAAMGSGDPLEAPGLPLGTPDLRQLNRAVEDAEGASPLNELSFPQRDAFGRPAAPLVVHWRPRARRGAPCFPGAYDDTSARCPDLRATGDRLGPHPRRTVLHIRPPEGFFATGINGSLVTPTVADLPIDPTATATQVIRPVEVMRALGLLEEGIVDALVVGGEVVLPDRLIVAGDLALPAGVRLRFEDLLFTGRLSLPEADTRLELVRCAVADLVPERPTDEPSVEATDCLFGTIGGAGGFVQLVYCTVLGETTVGRLWASDCLFEGPLVDITCSGGETCIRYSRVPDLAAVEGCTAGGSATNTDDAPNFIRLWFDDPDGCTRRPARFGEPGAGVLDLTSSARLRRGAEDAGEMGAYHHRHHAAGIRALEAKLKDFLPLRQEVTVRYDAHLARRPVQIEEEG